MDSGEFIQYFIDEDYLTKRKSSHGQYYIQRYKTCDLLMFQGCGTEPVAMHIRNDKGKKIFLFNKQAIPRAKGSNPSTNKNGIGHRLVDLLTICGRLSLDITTVKWIDDAPFAFGSRTGTDYLLEVDGKRVLLNSVVCSFSMNSGLPFDNKEGYPEIVNLRGRDHAITAYKAFLTIDQYALGRVDLPYSRRNQVQLSLGMHVINEPCTTVQGARRLSIPSSVRRNSEALVFPLRVDPHCYEVPEKDNLVTAFWWFVPTEYTPLVVPEELLKEARYKPMAKYCGMKGEIRKRAASVYSIEDLIESSHSELVANYGLENAVIFRRYAEEYKVWESASKRIDSMLSTVEDSSLLKTVKGSVLAGEGGKIVMTGGITIKGYQLPFTKQFSGYWEVVRYNVLDDLPMRRDTINTKLLRKFRRPRITGRIAIYRPSGLSSTKKIPDGGEVIIRSLPDRSNCVKVEYQDTEYTVFLKDLKERN